MRWAAAITAWPPPARPPAPDRKSTRLNSSHMSISYAVFCLKKKKKKKKQNQINNTAQSTETHRRRNQRTATTGYTPYNSRRRHEPHTQEQAAHRPCSHASTV